MSIGSSHMLRGLLLAGDVYPLLKVDDGGTWRLDLPNKYRKLIGRRVQVEGSRSEFDMLDVIKAKLIERK